MAQSLRGNGNSPQWVMHSRS